MEDKKWTVCVTCFTYNQAPYITDTMDGFCMQQTDFPYVCCIVDDASKDGEQNIIQKYLTDNFDLNDTESLYIEEKEYGTLVFTRHKTNRNCYFAVLFLTKNYYGSQELKRKKRSFIAKWEDSSKYIALCEGDDYWIDSKKLQIQVDFLETNPKVSLCFHNVKVAVEPAVNFNKDLYDHLHEGYYSGKEILERWTIPTVSVLFRNICKNYNNDNRYIAGDIVLWLNSLNYGYIYCIDKKMAVYRRLKGGATARSPQFLVPRYIMHYTAIKDNFPQYSDIIDNIILDYQSQLILIKLKYDPSKVPDIITTLSFVNKIKVIICLTKNVFCQIYKGIAKIFKKP